MYFGRTHQTEAPVDALKKEKKSRNGCLPSHRQREAPQRHHEKKSAASTRTTVDVRRLGEARAEKGRREIHLLQFSRPIALPNRTMASERVSRRFIMNEENINEVYTKEDSTTNSLRWRCSTSPRGNGPRADHPQAVQTLRWRPFYDQQAGALVPSTIFRLS